MTYIIINSGRRKSNSIVLCTKRTTADAIASLPLTYLYVYSPNELIKKQRATNAPWLTLYTYIIQSRSEIYRLAYKQKSNTDDNSSLNPLTCIHFENKLISRAQWRPKEASIAGSLSHYSYVYKYKKRIGISHVYIRMYNAKPITIFRFFFFFWTAKNHSPYTCTLLHPRKKRISTQGPFNYLDRLWSEGYVFGRGRWQVCVFYIHYAIPLPNVL